MAMPDSDTAHYRTGTQVRRAQYARWARLLDTILPPPDANRLVSVAEVGRASLPLVEGSLADVGLTAVVNPVRTTNGEERFKVLVPARDAAIAEEVVVGC
jgi:hypothetical protein